MRVAKALLGVALLSGVVLAHPAVPHGAKNQARFERVKTNILRVLDRKIGFLQKRKACVEQAQNWKELRNCRPHRRMWHRPLKKVEAR